jgi:transposase
MSKCFVNNLSRSLQKGRPNGAREAMQGSSVRNRWTGYDDRDAGLFRTYQRERLRALERENRELRRANEILKAASSFFARELDPRLPR